MDLFAFGLPAFLCSSIWLVLGRVGSCLGCMGTKYRGSVSVSACFQPTWDDPRTAPWALQMLSKYMRP